MKRAFEVKQKTFSMFHNCFFKLEKQTSKNVADTTLCKNNINMSWSIFQTHFSGRKGNGDRRQISLLTFSIN